MTLIWQLIGDTHLGLMCPLLKEHKTDGSSMALMTSYNYYLEVLDPVSF